MFMLLQEVAGIKPAREIKKTPAKRGIYDAEGGI
jgi:hypothetical protein